MNEDDVRQQLVARIGTRKKVHLTRGFSIEPRHNGVVVALGEEWVVLHQFHDFYPEGFTALRVRDVIDVRSGEYERYWERMLSAEGLLDRVAVPGDMPLDDVHHLLVALRQSGQNVIVECEAQDEVVQDFYIGQILSVDQSALHFAHFDGLGRWDDAPHTIPFEEITKVQFETPYVQTFSKYLESPCRLSNRT